MISYTVKKINIVRFLTYVNLFSDNYEIKIKYLSFPLAHEFPKAEIISFTTEGGGNVMNVIEE